MHALLATSAIIHDREDQEAGIHARTSHVETHFLMYRESDA